MPGGEDRQYVRWSCSDGVATLVICNGPMNVISSGVTAEFSEGVDEMRGNPAVRVIVITGAGDRAFMAGADIKEFSEVMKRGDTALFKARRELTCAAFEKFAALPQPTIAAVNGLAYGGGTELALLCDLRIASENVRFCLPEIKLGLFPAGGGTQRLPRLVGKARAKEMMFLGEPISAEEALQMGLVNRVVPAGQALAAAQDLAKQLAGKSAVALKLMKRVIDQGSNMDLAAGLSLESELFEEVFETEDAREGIAAFLEKRQPRFRHR